MIRIAPARQLLQAPGRHPARLTLLLGCAVAALSCSAPETGHEQWDSLTEREVVQRLGSPTGELPAASTPQNQRTLQQPLPGLFEAAHYLAQVLADLDELAADDQSDAAAELPESTTPHRDGSDKTWSTNLYLRLACPGNDVDPPFDFAQGQLRLNSPEFDGLDFAALIDQGEFLLSFDECDLGPITLDARLPGRYLPTDSPVIGTLFSDPDFVPRHLIALDASDAADGTLGVLAVACGREDSPCREDVRLAAEVRLPNAGSYVVAFRGTRAVWYDWWQHGYTSTTTIDIDLIASDGTASCSAAYDTQGARLDCDR